MSRVLGITLSGVDGAPVEVEVRISSQLPRVDVVGLPEAAVRESSARVRAAIQASGLRFPDRRVTVNLAPAELRKSGAGLDLPIAMGILAASGAIPASELEGVGFVGELALDGRLRPIRGALALAIAARDAGSRQVVVPVDNAAEAALAPRVEVIGAAHLPAVLAHVMATEKIAPTAVAWSPANELAETEPDLCDVHGQESAKRALEIAAAGGHGLLLTGPPGSGKTMLAKRLPGLLPAMSLEEALEATRIHSCSGAIGIGARPLDRRPFRAPHHTASPAGLLGGGNPPRPGEISLAHRGVLFLDELPEFDRRCLEALREVLENRSITLARARYSCRFPAHFLLVAACNPCPCGWYGSDRRDCRCDSGVIERYQRRISGPLLDRIDLHVSVPPVPWRALDGCGDGLTSAAVRVRCEAARERQRQRSGAPNADLTDRELDHAMAASPEARKLLGRAVERLGLSARSARRLLRVARTIADLADEPRVEVPSMAEALRYRGAGDAPEALHER